MPCPCRSRPAAPSKGRAATLARATATAISLWWTARGRSSSKCGARTFAAPTSAAGVAQAMKTYGMFLADGGNVALTAQSDRFTTAKWDGLLGARDLEALRPRDFEMVEGGARISLTLDCVRNP